MVKKCDRKSSRSDDNEWKKGPGPPGPLKKSWDFWTSLVPGPQDHGTFKVSRSCPFPSRDLPGTSRDGTVLLPSLVYRWPNPTTLDWNPLLASLQSKMIPTRSISSFLILILISQQVFCQDDVQSQMLKRIEKLETELNEKSDVITEIITVR